MIRLPHTLAAWGRPGFGATLKAELEGLDAACLPLQQGLTGSSYVADKPFEVTILGVSEHGDLIRARAGVFYSGIVAGCSCADDPTPLDEQAEYCVVQIDIDKATGEAMATLAAE